MIVEEQPWCDPAEAADRLRPLGGLAFLDSAMLHPTLGRYSYVAAAPIHVLKAVDGRCHVDGAPVEGFVLDTLQRLLASRGCPRVPDLPPFQGGAIGLLGYETGLDLHGLTRSHPGVGPDAQIHFYDAILTFDHEAGRAWLLAEGSKGEAAARRLRASLAADTAEPPSHPTIPRAAWRSNFDRTSFCAAVSATIEAILDGEIFQANIAQRFEAALPPGFDPWAFYRHLRRVNPAPFASFLDFGARIVASSSPELFLAIADDHVETRPIKGTAPRAVDPAEDRARAARLGASEKDRAENTMIVDLLRNDLSRVCRPHTVAVPTLCGLESYAGVHHLVSSVTGRLAEGRTALDAIAAAFPGGSITGAPKQQAMRVIDRIERQPRGAYCGSIGWFGRDGSSTTNIAIRTVTFEDGHASFHAGGGITALSNPDAEYEETLVKAERIFQAFEGP